MKIIETITPDTLPVPRYQARCLDCETGAIRARNNDLGYIRGAAEAHVEHFGHRVVVEDTKVSE